MNKKVQSPETYDDMFVEGGAGGVFDLPYKRSAYYPLFRAVAKELRASGRAQVLEVGCGTGSLAHLLHDTASLDYRGFDFSTVAVAKARERLALGERFFVGDATDPSTYQGLSYDSIICTEVLEHVEQDRQVIAQWKSGTFCVCSVPNYDSATHVRVFKTEDDVRRRYGNLMDIRRVQRLRKPFLTDRSFGSWLQAVRWNRYRPQRLMWLLGFTDFDRDGGWFVFTGVRR